jgi:hypothetical protein
MVTLIKDVVGLESEAEAIVIQAHAEAKQLENAAEEEIVACRAELTGRTHRKIAEFQRYTEETYKRVLAEAEEELQAALDALDRIPHDKLSRQVDLIVSRFKDL